MVRRGPEKGPGPILTTFCGITIWYILTEGFGLIGHEIASAIDSEDAEVMMNGRIAGRTLGFFVFLVSAVCYALNQIDKHGR